MEILFYIFLAIVGIIFISNSMTKRNIRKIEDETIRIRERTEKLQEKTKNFESGEGTLTEYLYGKEEAEWEESLPEFVSKCEEYASIGDSRIFELINNRQDSWWNLPRIKRSRSDDASLEDHLKMQDYERDSFKEAKDKLIESLINGSFSDPYYILSPCFHFEQMHGGGYENQKKLEEKLKEAKIKISDETSETFKNQIHDYVVYKEDYVPTHFPDMWHDSNIIIYLYPHMFKFFKDDIYIEDVESLTKRFDELFGENKHLLINNFEKSRKQQLKKENRKLEKVRTITKFTASQAQKYLDLSLLYLFDNTDSSKSISKDLLDELIEKALETKITKTMKEKIDRAKNRKSNI